MPSENQINEAMQSALKQQACGQQETVECDVEYAIGGLVGKATNAKQLYRPSFKNQLVHQMQHHESEVKRLKRLITLLDSNPEVQEILELSKGY